MNPSYILWSSLVLLEKESRPNSKWQTWNVATTEPSAVRTKWLVPAHAKETVNFASSLKVLWILLVIYMCILAAGDVIIGIRGWSTCTINKNVGRWPIGAVVFLVIFDTVTSGAKFRREKYDKAHLIGITVAYFGSLAWNIVGKPDVNWNNWA